MKKSEYEEKNFFCGYCRNRFTKYVKEPEKMGKGTDGYKRNVGLIIKCPFCQNFIKAND